MGGLIECLTIVTKQRFFYFFILWLPFIQMHMVINISLDSLIGIWIQTNNFIIKKIVWLFID
jgi:hypothetical protein